MSLYDWIRDDIAQLVQPTGDPAAAGYGEGNAFCALWSIDRERTSAGPIAGRDMDIYPRSAEARTARGEGAMKDVRLGVSFVGAERQPPNRVSKLANVVSAIVVTRPDSR